MLPFVEPRKGGEDGREELDFEFDEEMDIPAVKCNKLVLFNLREGNQSTF